MSKKNKNNKDEYAYDFIPALSHTTNIDEQREKAKHLENVTKCQKTNNNKKI